MDASQWDTRYSSAPAVWSPHANRTLVERCPPAPPGGRSLDLGCGEGADTRWLAGRGWLATGADFSAVAVERARQHSAGLAEPRPVYAVAEATDLGALRALSPDGLFDLVTVAYLHPEPEDRERTFAPLTGLMAEGGYLFVLNHHPEQYLVGPQGHHEHAGGSEPEHGQREPTEPADDVGPGPSPHRLLTPEEVVAALLPGAEIDILTAEVIRYVGPTGSVSAVDSLVIARRRVRSERTQ